MDQHSKDEMDSENGLFDSGIWVCDESCLSVLPPGKSALLGLAADDNRAGKASVEEGSCGSRGPSHGGISDSGS